MNYNDIYEMPREARVRGYESNVERPMFTQGVQPVVMDDWSVKENKQVPIYYSDTETLTFKESFFMLICQFVPVVGLILSCIWAFTPGEVTPKKVFSKALVACHGIVLAISALLIMTGTIKLF